MLLFFSPETRCDLLITEFLLPAECSGFGCGARGQSHYEQRHSASLITRSVCRLSDARNESHGEMPTNTAQFQLVWQTTGSPRISAVRIWYFWRARGNGSAGVNKEPLPLSLSGRVALKMNLLSVDGHNTYHTISHNNAPWHALLPLQNTCHFFILGFYDSHHHNSVCLHLIKERCNNYNFLVITLLKCK